MSERYVVEKVEVLEVVRKLRENPDNVSPVGTFVIGFLGVEEFKSTSLRELGECEWAPGLEETITYLKSRGFEGDETVYFKVVDE